MVEKEELSKLLGYKVDKKLMNHYNDLMNYDEKRRWIKARKKNLENLSLYFLREYGYNDDVFYLVDDEETKLEHYKIYEVFFSGDVKVLQKYKTELTEGLFNSHLKRPHMHLYQRKIDGKVLASLYTQKFLPTNFRFTNMRHLPDVKTVENLLDNGHTTDYITFSLCHYNNFLELRSDRNIVPSKSGNITDILKLLFDRGEDINFMHSGYNLLHHSIFSQYFKSYLFEFLIENGAIVEQSLLDTIDISYFEYGNECLKRDILKCVDKRNESIKKELDKYLINDLSKIIILY